MQFFQSDAGQGKTGITPFIKIGRLLWIKMRFMNNMIVGFMQFVSKAELYNSV